MSKKFYSEPEAIFSVPDDVTSMDITDALSHAVSRVQGSIVTLSMSIEGKPEKYFTVPDGQPFDCDTYETIMDRIEFLNKCSEDLADGCEIAFGNEYAISYFSHMISSYLYQAKKLMETGEK